REPEPDEREVAAQLAAREPGADDGREQECVAPPRELEAEEHEGRGRDTERGREGAARGTVESHVREGSSVVLVAGSVAVGHTAVGDPVGGHAAVGGSDVGLPLGGPRSTGLLGDDGSDAAVLLVLLVDEDLLDLDESPLDVSDV